ncbi:Hypothetical protein PBC10988_32450 [Planctomycetales bacterium 10988]|nr:Hypothetical protein PBC10988_32450 [Planctomycetales bacterium 10988]
MNIKPILRIFFVLLLTSPLVAVEQPNIVLIMADDLGYGDIEPFGNRQVETPHLTRLANQGTRLTQFYANAPVCSPTRAALLTGRYQQRTGVHAVYVGKLSRDEVTIAEKLGSLGYATGIFGKWHVRGHARSIKEFAEYRHDVPTTFGFDSFVGIMSGMIDGRSHYTERGYHDWWHNDVNTKEDGYATHLLAKHATDFVRQHADQPFFLYVPLTDIHFPWMTPEDEPYYAEGINNPPSAYPERKRGGQHHGTDRLLGVVHRMIHEVDVAVGQIVSAVEEAGLRDRTLIIFTSDNGGYSSYGNLNVGEISNMGGLRGQKHQVYEGGIRVPMIASMTGTIPESQTSDAVAMTADLFPTFVELAGGDVSGPNDPKPIDGVSLWSHLTTGKPLPERSLYWNDIQRWAMRDGDWKLVLTSPIADPELYDLASDQEESNDLSGTHPERVRFMLTQMNEWSKDVGTLKPFPMHTIGESQDAAYRKGVQLFIRKHAAGNVPDSLRDMTIQSSSIEGGLFQVQSGGELAALTPADATTPWSQARKLARQGFHKDETITPFRMWSNQQEPVAVFRKQVSTGDIIRIQKVCLLLQAEGVELDVYKPSPSWRDNDGETLYNGIVLPKVWPPDHLEPNGEPMPLPYLDAPPAVIPINVGRQLFVDDFLIEHTDLERKYHSTKKYAGNPVFVAETEVERKRRNCVYLGQGGLFWDADASLYKMFYTAGWRGPLAMATSKDLIHWVRPDLDGAGNNFLLPAGTVWQGVDTTVAGSDNAVWFDAEASDPMNRLRYLTCWMHHPGFSDSGSPTHSLTRSDGNHWMDCHPVDRLDRVSDYSSFFYNPFRRKWVHSIKVNTRLGRSRNYLETDEFLEGTKISDSVFWTAADRLDAPEPERTYPGESAQAQLYNLSAVAYESLMVGMHQIHRGPPNSVCQAGKFPKLCDLELGFSRDGFHWHRPDRSGFIRGSRTEGAWDRGYIHTTTGVFVVHEDQLVFPFCAFSGKGLEGEPDGMYNGAAIGLAMLRLDGFASLNAGKDEGTLLTRPVRFAGRDLHVNLDAPVGQLTVELLDRDRNLLATSEPISGDSTRLRIRWLDREDLSDFAGQPVRFRFKLSNGSLYSFWVSKESNSVNDSANDGGYRKNFETR